MKILNYLLAFDKEKEEKEKKYLEKASPFNTYFFLIFRVNICIMELVHPSKAILN